MQNMCISKCKNDYIHINDVSFSTYDVLMWSIYIIYILTKSMQWSWCNFA